MAIKGGKRPGAGRKAGVPNKRTLEIKKRADAIQQTAQAEGKLPLDVMLEAMHKAYEQGGAAAAFPFAKDAAPYLHAKLSSIEATGKDGEALHPPVIQFVTNANPPQ